MLFNVSYRNKEIEEEIERTVGKSIGYLRRLKLKGIGSQRFILEDASPKLKALFDKQTGTPFCNIELKESGILIWFRVKLHNWVLALPYRGLSVYKSQNLLTIHHGAWKVSLSPAHNMKLKLSFVEKLLRIKNESEGLS